MMRQIKESDWKIFRQLHTVALERLCQQILSEVEHISAGRASSAHQKYLKIYELLQRRDKEVAELFDDFRRSTALIQLTNIKARGLLTEEEFLRFSEETRNFVEALLG